MLEKKEIGKQNNTHVLSPGKHASSDRSAKTTQPSNLPGTHHFLQRNLGNSLMQSMVQGPRLSEGRKDNSSLSTSRGAISHKGSSSCCPSKSGAQAKIQPKLAIGPANDVYEQEADRVAEQVMRMPDSWANNEPNHLDRGIKIRRVTDHRCGGINSSPDIQLNQSGGRPLSDSTCKFMEPRFGVDFSYVRLHADRQAHEKASQINARAFAIGNHIYFGNGESEQNRGLIAHELTHVIQQSNGLNNSIIQRAVRFSTNNPLRIIHWTDGVTTPSGDVWRIVYGDLEYEADIHAEADDPSEFANWEVGLMQTERVEWNRRYWNRPNTDRRGRFLERKLKIPPVPLRDHVTNSIWYAPTAYESVATRAAGGNIADITLSTNDMPASSMIVSASTRSGDASDGADNSYQFRAGMNFVNYVSAHNAATNEWRHLELIYRSAQAEVDFQSDPIAGVAIRTDNRILGQSRRFRWSRAADQPAIGGTLANTYVNDPSNWTLNRVDGWT